MINDTSYVRKPIKTLRRILAFARDVDYVSVQSAVFLAVVARFSKFLSFLLPFKALLVATNPGFTIQFAGMGLNHVELSAAALVFSLLFFVVYSSSSAAVRSLVKRAAIRVEISGGSSDSLDQPEDETEHSIRNAVAFRAAIAAAVLLAAAISYVSLVITALIVSSVILVLIRARALSADCGADNVQAVVTSAVERYFFFVQFASLGAIVFLIVELGSFSVLAGIYLFVAMRQLLSSMTEVVRLVVTYQSRELPDYIVRGAPELLDTTEQASSVPKYLRGECTEDWILSALRSLGVNTKLVRAYQWRETGLRHVHSFQISVSSADASDSYLLNIYGPRSKKFFWSERSYLELNDKQPGGRRYAGSTTFESYSITLLEGGLKPVTRKMFDSGLSELLLNQWASTPEELKGVRIGHHKYVGAALLDLLYALSTVAQSDNQRAAIEYLISNFEEMERIRANLPLALDNPELSSRSALQDNSGELLPGVWGRVCLEPIGSFLWRMRSSSSVDCDDLARRLGEARLDCASLTGDHLEFAAACYGLSKVAQNGYLNSAVDSVVTVSTILRRLKESETSSLTNVSAFENAAP